MAEMVASAEAELAVEAPVETTPES
jgi:hypothetical protein